MFKFDIMNIMAQPNAWDCGVFAIACATDIAHDRDPVLSQWDSTREEVSRKLCWAALHITFSNCQEKACSFGRHCIEETIHCTCRMPNDKQSAMIFFAVVVTHGIMALLSPSIQNGSGHVSNVYVCMWVHELVFMCTCSCMYAGVHTCTPMHLSMACTYMYTFRLKKGVRMLSVCVKMTLCVSVHVYTSVTHLHIWT